MAGNFSRINYDECAYKKEIKQSTEPLSYMLENYCSLPTNIKHLGTYAAAQPNHHISTFNGDLSKLVDVENQLKGVHRLRSKCTEEQFPSKDNLCVTNKLQESKYTEQSSRLTDPIYNYRGMTINRFLNQGTRPNSVCQNYAENTRMSAKDRYVATHPEQSKAL